MLVAVAAVAGLAVGSFLNVVASRVPEHRSIVHPRSRCPNCLHQITPAENIPLVSYAVLRGRCRACGWRIPLRYPLTELGTAAAFAICAWRVGGGWRLPLALVFTAALVAITITDLEYKRIPTPIVYGSLLLVLPLVALTAWSEHRWGAVGVGLLGALGFSGALGAVHEMDRRWMGFGDVRLALLIGLVLGYFGLPVLLTGVFVAFFAGAVIGMFLIAAGLSRFGKAIPFGPYLALGAFVATLTGDSIARAWLRIVGGG